MRSNVITLALGAAGVVLLAACGSSTSPYGAGGGGGVGGGGGGAGHTTSLTVGNNFFSPTPDTVTAGATVTWTWSASSNPHTVNWDTGPGALPSNSGASQTSGTYQATLTTVGTYTYHCAVHGAAMSGTLVVK